MKLSVLASLSDGIRHHVVNSFEHCYGLIRVWRVSLDALPWQRCEDVLSPDESERARRYQFDNDRRRFTVTRTVLRFLLSNYLKTKPERVVFNYGKHGKPSLAEPSTGFASTFRTPRSWR